MVIQNLHDDVDTLADCSLVARSWVPTSSCLLFRELYWPPEYGPLLPDPSGEQTIVQLIEALSASVRLQSAIRQLHLRDGPEQRRSLPRTRRHP